MWNYEKRLEYPVKITNTNPKIAQVIMSQYGGPDGEMGASLRYLSQRYSMSNSKVAGLLTDIGREAPEMLHFRIYPYIQKIETSKEVPIPISILLLSFTNEFS